jgi:hypothetical protein
VSLSQHVGVERIPAAGELCPRPTPTDALVLCSSFIAGVGFYNHKFFLSFVLYAFLGCTFVCIVGFPDFFRAVGEGPARVIAGTGRARSLAAAALGPGKGAVLGPASPGSGVSEHSAVTSAMLVVGYILTSAFSFALGIFVLFHAYLVARGKTTIEMYEIDPFRAARVARYDLGLWENMRLVFGDAKAHWPLPTRCGIEGDGLSFARPGDVPRASPTADGGGHV